MESSEFRSFVNGTQNTIEKITGDLAALYNHYQIEHTGQMSAHDLCAHINDQLRAMYTTDKSVLKLMLRRLQRVLILEHFLESKPLQPYLGISAFLLDTINSAKPQKRNGDNWAGAIQKARDLMILQPGIANTLSDPKLHTRNYIVAGAAQRLLHRGYHLEIRDSTVWISDQDRTNLVSSLLDIISQLGCIQLADQIFSVLNPMFDQDLERYHLIRKFQPRNGEYPHIPFGYILSLAEKQAIRSHSTPADAEELWVELIELSSDFVALYDVQPYCRYSHLFQDHTTLLPFLRELGIFENLFSITQQRPRDTVLMINGILQTYIQRNAQTQEGWQFAELTEIALALLVISDGRKRPIFINDATLKPLCPRTRPEIIKDILREVFSHPPDGANAGYIVPSDIPGPDFMFKPLLSDGKGGYWLLNCMLCAPACIETLLTQLRRIDINVDQELGSHLESFLREEFQKRGITCYSGQYFTEGKTYECDLVVQSSDCLIFFEIKKKPLTRKARAGLDTEVIVDLSASLLEAQLQAGRHEICIRRNGYIDLTDPTGTVVRLERRDRDIERIAVTFLDYGGYQDRIVLEKFLQISLGVEYATTDPALQNKFKDLESKQKELRKQYFELADLDERRTEKPFFNCWFLSIPQLLVLIDQTHSEEDLKSSLWQTRHMTTGTLNFYFEHSQMLRLRRSKKN